MANLSISVLNVQGDMEHWARGEDEIHLVYPKAYELGVRSERLKTELITNVSHDLKTPMTSIINYAQRRQRTHY